MAKPLKKPKEKMYDVIIPKVYAPSGEDALFISVNDENIRIKYGEKVRVPARFKEAVNEWLRANEYADARCEEITFDGNTN